VIDHKSNIADYKTIFAIEIAPVCKDDLIILNKQTSKELGGIGPLLLCYKLSSKIHLINIVSFNTYEYDENTYWKYNFKSFIDKQSLNEYLIINVNEEIDYKKIKINASSTMNYSIKNQLTDSSRPNSHTLEKNKFKIVEVQCIVNSENSGNYNLITLKSHLGNIIKPGDIFYGYDLSTLNFDDENEILKENLPDVILIKKKNIKRKNRKWKLKHLDKQKEDIANSKSTKKQNKKLDNDIKDYEDFLEDIEVDADTRDKILLFKKRY